MSHPAAWLSYHSAGDNFSPQPFGQAAKVLFDMGYNKDARDILLEKERLLTEKGQLIGACGGVGIFWLAMAMNGGGRLRRRQ